MRIRALAIFLLLFLSFSSIAQLRIGPEVGLNMSTINASGNTGLTTTGSNLKSVSSTISSLGLNSSYNPFYGVRAGFSADYAFTDNLSAQSGLYYTMMGSTITSQALSYWGNKLGLGESSLNINYMTLPLNAVYKVDAGSGRFFIGAGAYVAYGIGGINKTGAITTDSLSIRSISTNVKFGSDTNSFKALDYGVNAITGYEFDNGFLFRLGYSYGLQNFSNLNGTNFKHSSFYFCMGWLLGGGGGKRY